MAQKKTTKTEQAKNTAEEGFHSEVPPETEESASWRTGWRVSPRALAGAACDVSRQMEDAFMALVPREVTEHLLNSKKELVRAGQRLGERMIEKLDEKAARARALHEHPADEGGEGRSSGGA